MFGGISSPARWMNATTGPDENPDGYGFCLND